MEKLVIGIRTCQYPALLSGCVRMDSNGNPDTSGIVYRVLVHPMGQAITYLVENFNWSYGWAVIAMTVIVRIIILPLGISQSKNNDPI